MGSRRKLRFWGSSVLALNLLLCLLTLAAYSAPLIPPDVFWPVAFVGMAFPYLLVINFLFVLWWLFRRWKWALLSLCTVALGWPHLRATVGLGLGAFRTDEDAVKVMSYNVRLFDLYNWRDNVLTRNEIFDLLIAEDADIICLQEFFHQPGSKFFPTKDTLLRAMRQQHYHDDYVQRTKKGHQFGIATFSSYPIVDKGRVDLENDINNICIWSDLLVNHDTIRVYNAHLASIGFQEADYQLYDEMGPNELGTGGKRIGGLLKRAFVKRAFQAERIAQHMAQSPYPIIYCGDMNDTPVSYAYAQLDNQLEDAFTKSGFGLGGTYIGNLPSFRIDHIMHSPELQSYGFQTLSDELSDHRAITSYITW